MKRDEIKVGIKVTDTAFDGVGTIIDVKKTVFTVEYTISGKIKYDYPHAQFLSPFTPAPTKKKK